MTRFVGPVSDRLTVSRASVGTYYDASGVMQTASANILRYDYDPLTKVLRGALIEAAATNMQLWSSDLSQTFYNKSGVTIGTFDQAPTRLIESAANAAHLISNGGVTVTAGQRYSISGEFRANGRDRFRISGNGANFPARVVVNLLAKTIQPQGAGAEDLALVDLGGGYFRASYSAVAPTSGATGLVVAMQNDAGSESYLGDGVSGIITRRLQFEIGAVPTSHVITTGAAVTRSADQVTFAAPAGSNTVTYTFDNLATSVATGVSGTVTIPTNLTRRHFRKIVARPA